MFWRCSSEGKKERRQLVLPYSLQRKVIQDLHEGAVGAHLGEEKVLSQLKERFYWPGCTEAVKMWCRASKICASRKMTTPARKHTHCSVHTPHTICSAHPHHAHCLVHTHNTTITLLIQPSPHTLFIHHTHTHPHATDTHCTPQFLVHTDTFSPHHTSTHCSVLIAHTLFSLHTTHDTAVHSTHSI